MDPKKLAAVMGDKGGAPQPAKPGGGGGGRPGGGKGNKGGGGGGGGNPHDVHPDVDEQDEAPEDESEELDSELKPYAELVKALEDNSDDVENSLDGLDQEFLTDSSATPDDEQRQELEEVLEGLPQDLTDLMRQHLPGCSWDDAMGIASHLEEEGMISDADPVAGLLFHAGQVLGSGEPEQE